MACVEEYKHKSGLDGKAGLVSCTLDMSKAELPILLILTLILNVISAIILHKLRHTFQSTDTLMVDTLTINDAVSTAIFIVMWVAGWATCGCVMLTSPYVCASLGCVASTLVLWSAWIITVMSACRYLAIKRPFIYRYYVKTFQIKVILAVSLCLTFLQFTGPFFGIAEPFRYLDENKICAYDFTAGHGEPSHRYILLLIAIEGFCLVALVLFFNISITMQLRRTNVVHPEPTQGRTEVTTNSRTKRTAFANVTKVVSAVYCLCYAPFLIRLMYDVVDNTPHQDDLRHSVTMTLLFMSPLLNPMVYVACNRRYRQYIIDTFRKVCKRKKPAKDVIRDTNANDTAGSAQLATQTTRA